MKPITEYQDYRTYMLDYFEWRKRSSAFSWRKFSKIAGFSSPSYLKLVCDGKSSLSRVGVMPRLWGSLTMSLNISSTWSISRMPVMMERKRRLSSK